MIRCTYSTTNTTNKVSLKYIAFIEAKQDNPP